MRDYCRDLEARITALPGTLDDRTLECLAFAEARLLWIHPFEDFNGRVTRAFLAELLQRLDMPTLDPTPDPAPNTEPRTEHRTLSASAQRRRSGRLAAVGHGLARAVRKGGRGMIQVHDFIDPSPTVLDTQVLNVE